MISMVDITIDIVMINVIFIIHNVLILLDIVKVKVLLRHAK